MTDEGRSILHSAAESGNTTIIQLLLDKGANIEARDELGFSALHRAVCYSKHAAVYLLLDKGANLNSASYSGATLPHSAARVVSNAMK